MNILALDSSSKAASAAVLRDGQLAGEFFINTALTHSQTLLPMVRSLLDCAGIPMEEIGAFAVSTGPGSFTGLRIGISAVKGMALPGGTPCIPVSTLEGLAMNLAAFTGTIIPAMDARRSQVYTAAFSCRGGALTRVFPDTALPVDALRKRLEDTNDPVMLVGDGAVLCKAAMEDLAHVCLAPESLLHQRAASVAFVAAGLSPDSYLTADALVPSYLRLPQAERERMEKLKKLIN